DGFDALRAGEAKSLEGLRAPDDMTIEVTLSRPFVPFFSKLADPAFAPLPSIAYEDIGAYGRQPVGNGRYELVAYDPGREAVLHRYEDWAGDDPGRAQEVVFVIYAGDSALQAAYQDVRSGALDVLDTVPPE